MILGGVEQWVLVRGRRADAPILLKIHGGPGQAEMPTIDMNAELEEHFLVVEWDQRGAGKSAAAVEPREAMTLEQIVTDTIELTERLVVEFGPREVILLGHSWGSLVGVLAVHRRPDLYAAFVSTGQIASFADGQRAAHAFAVAEAEHRDHAPASTALATIAAPPYLGAAGLASWMHCVKWLGEFGAIWHQPEKFRPVRWMVASPEYAWPEKLRFTKAATRSFELLYDDLARAEQRQPVRALEHDRVVGRQVERMRRRRRRRDGTSDLGRLHRRILAGPSGDGAEILQLDDAVPVVAELEQHLLGVLGELG
jgi:pimeloyl-ACP methyl ester carboxylesterase